MSLLEGVIRNMRAARRANPRTMFLMDHRDPMLAANTPSFPFLFAYRHWQADISIVFVLLSWIG
jgi:hypothetical protein